MKSTRSHVSYDDLGKLVLRCGLALLMLSHGLYKLANGHGHVLQYFADAGLPTFLGHGALLTEVIVPVLLIAGYRTREAAAAMVGSMLVAIALVHRAQVFTLNSHGGWGVELNGLFIVGGLAIVLLGSGRYAFEGGARTWLSR